MQRHWQTTVCLALYLLFSSTSAHAQGQQRSSYGRNTLLYTGTEVDWRGEVQNRGTQFPLPASGPLTVHVNLARTQPDGGLGLGSMRFRVTLRDFRLNDIAVVADFKTNDLDPRNRYHHFFFLADRPGVYYVEVFDGYDFWVNATSVIVGR
jgi:hypothetical protein